MNYKFRLVKISQLNSMNSKMVAQVQGLVFACLLVLVYMKDPYQMNQRYPAYVQLAFLGIALVMFLTYFYTLYVSTGGSGTISQMYSKMLISLAVIMSLFGVIVGVGWALQRYPTFIPFIFSLLKIGMLIGAFYLMVTALPKTLPNMKVGGDDQYAKMVLLIEFILVALYVGTPYVLRFLMYRSGNIVIQEPQYLSEESSYEIQKLVNPNYRFGVSAWFNINPQPNNTREAFTKFTNILSRDDAPIIEYNSSTRTFRIRTQTVDDIKETFYETKNIPLQTWNNVVVNYDGGSMDVYFNGELVVSKSNVIPYESDTTIMVRAGEKDGLEGGICNVVCFLEPLTSEAINFQYRLLKEYHTPFV